MYSQGLVQTKTTKKNEIHGISENNFITLWTWEDKSEFFDTYLYCESLNFSCKMQPPTTISLHPPIVYWFVKYGKFRYFYVQ